MFFLIFHLTFERGIFKILTVRLKNFGQVSYRFPFLVQVGRKVVLLAFQFRFDKTLQAAGMFLRLNGGSMTYLRLLKLLYLADRQCLAVEGDTITGDRARAMPKGPVLRTTYNLIKRLDSQSPRWHRFIKSGEDFSVFVAEDPGTDDLCRFEKEIIEQVYHQYRDVHAFDLIDLTHEFPEWKKYEKRLKDPKQRKSYPISIKEMLDGLKKPEMIERVRQNIAAERFHRELFNNQ